MKNSNNNRFFKLIILNNKKIKQHEQGRYKTKHYPKNAAKKIFRQLSNKYKNIQSFFIQETTQGSSKNIYGPYVGEKIKRKKPLKIRFNQKNVYIEYKYHIKLLKIKNQRGGRTQEFKNKEWKNILNLNIITNEYLYDEVYSNIEFKNINSLPIFSSLFEELSIKNTDCLMDIGSGLGLMCILLSIKFPFNKIYGIELNNKLYNKSKENISLSKINNITLFNKDIFKFNIPKDVTVFYLFNPFQQSLSKFELFLNKIKDHSKSLNKTMYIIWINHANEVKSANHYNILNNYKVSIIKEDILIYPYLILSLSS